MSTFKQAQGGSWKAILKQFAAEVMLEREDSYDPSRIGHYETMLLSETRTMHRLLNREYPGYMSDAKMQSRMRAHGVPSRFLTGTQHQTRTSALPPSPHGGRGRHGRSHQKPKPVQTMVYNPPLRSNSAVTPMGRNQPLERDSRRGNPADETPSFKDQAYMWYNDNIKKPFKKMTSHFSGGDNDQSESDDEDHHMMEEEEEEDDGIKFACNDKEVLFGPRCVLTFKKKPHQPGNACFSSGSKKCQKQATCTFGPSGKMHVLQHALMQELLCDQCGGPIVRRAKWKHFDSVAFYDCDYEMHCHEYGADNGGDFRLSKAEEHVKRASVRDAQLKMRERNYDMFTIKVMAKGGLAAEKKCRAFKQAAAKKRRAAEQRRAEEASAARKRRKSRHNSKQKPFGHCFGR